METQVYGLLWALDITFPVTLSIVLVSNCTLQLQKERSCHVRRKKDFSIHQSISSSHIVLLQIILNLEAFTHVSNELKQTFRGQIYICAYVHLQITGSDCHSSSSCHLLSHKSLQGYTNATGEIHAPSEPPLTMCTKSSYTETVRHVCLTLQISF